MNKVNKVALTQLFYAWFPFIMLADLSRPKNAVNSQNQNKANLNLIVRHKVNKVNKVALTQSFYAWFPFITLADLSRPKNAVNS